MTVAAIPLTGLIAYQAITEELCAKPGKTAFIPGGSGSLGQMAVPIAKALGLRIIVSGNARAKETLLSAGAYRFLFVRSDGAKLETITNIVETKHIVPQIDPHEFDLLQINDALKLGACGHINGKVIVRFS